MYIYIYICFAQKGTVWYCVELQGMEAWCDVRYGMVRRNTAEIWCGREFVALFSEVVITSACV